MIDPPKHEFLRPAVWSNSNETAKEGLALSLRKLNSDGARIFMEKEKSPIPPVCLDCALLKTRISQQRVFFWCVARKKEIREAYLWKRACKDFVAFSTMIR